MYVHRRKPPPPAPTDPAFVRGLINATPPSLLMWAAIGILARRFADFMPGVLALAFAAACVVLISAAVSAGACAAFDAIAR
jgi:hypothetical protein